MATTIGIGGISFIYYLPYYPIVGKCAARFVPLPSLPLPACPGSLLLDRHDICALDWHPETDSIDSTGFPPPAGAISRTQHMPTEERECGTAGTGGGVEGTG